MGHKASSLKVYLSSFVLLVVGTCFAIRGDNCNTLTRTQTNKVESIASISRTTKDTAMPHTDYPPVLTFISCNHTVSPSLPSNLPLPLRPSYDHRTLLVSQPGNCLDCTIAFTKRNTTDVLVDFASQLRDCEYNYTRRASAAAKNNQHHDAEAIRRYGQAEMVSISRRRAEAVASLWEPFTTIWAGARKASRTGNRSIGKEPGVEMEVLKVEFVKAYESRITKVRLVWRDRDGRGSIVQRKDIDLI